MTGKEIKITIDGKEYKTIEGTALLDFANRHGMHIPSLCYFEHIQPPLGTCRVCTVKVNGKPAAGCQERLKDGNKYEVQTPELQDLRQAMVEMLFAEGNHFCPACEKSGDCDLQGLGYQMGIRVSRFPHLFVDRLIDYRPKRILVEHNRCILCRRCMEEVHTSDNKKVFSFINRGNETEVAVDYEQEKKLTESEALHAMHICPTGAILVKGKSLPRPIGDRKYDIIERDETVLHEKSTLLKHGKEKFRVATTSLAGCFGCHMSLLDIDEELMDIVEIADFHRSPVTDIKEFTERCHVGIIEGGCCNSDNVEVLKEFREKCDVLIAMGECAIWGGLPAMRNTVPLEECLKEAYLNSMTSTSLGVIPEDEDLPKILDQVYPCNEIVHIDYYVPGCPPSAKHIWQVVKNILLGETYSIAGSEFKYD